ncbi:hypothetical protein WICPIJ_007206 [Wickerhamomyces pijperi]|uniref:Uncharacterized protein n=1 Tax=Wickerhamomyces pijperi TaxID=599730 RepID=A0A9P8TK57_WICPI|nr:hypothetical protein WICPIJ_007206 [Wickerhamomyces pijperi]
MSSRRTGTSPLTTGTKQTFNPLNTASKNTSNNLTSNIKTTTNDLTTDIQPGTDTSPDGVQPSITNVSGNGVDSDDVTRSERRSISAKSKTASPNGSLALPKSQSMTTNFKVELTRLRISTDVFSSHTGSKVFLTF